MNSLEHFFRPRAVAFVGASEDATKIGGRRYRSLIEEGFLGAIYPVHPTATRLRGHRAFRSLLDVPEPVDLAVVVVPTAAAPAVVSECAQRRIPAVLMVTAGFGEVDERGKRIEKEMVHTLSKVGSRLLGPNTSGLFDIESNLNVSGAHTPRGDIGLISQSGNLLLDFNQYARERGLGFSRQATLGNGADLNATDLLRGFLEDHNTRVVLAYLEGWGENEGRALFDLVKNRSYGKPVIFLKPGRSSPGRQAVKSHTGSLAGDDRVVEAALRQCGIIRARTIEGAWDLAGALCRQPWPQGDRVAVISDGGGHSSVLCDALGESGFSVPTFSESLQAALCEFLPERANMTNPIDFAGVAESDPNVWPRAAHICLSTQEVDSVIVAGHFGGYHKIGGPELESMELKAAKQLAALEPNGHGFIVHSIYADEPIPAHMALREAGISVLRSPEATAELLYGLRRAAIAHHRPAIEPARLSTPNHKVVKQLLATHDSDSNPNVLLEPDARALLEAYGITVPEWTVVDNATDCADAVHSFGPSVLKLIAKGVVHRSDINGVFLNVNQRDEALASYEKLIQKLPFDERRFARVLVTAMINQGIEFIIGALRDSQFGPVVMFGIGGITVEAVADVAFRLAPLTLCEANEMLDEIRARSLLGAFRGRPPIDRDAVSEILVRVGELLIDLPQVAELDLNPVFVDHTGIKIADARAVLNQPIRRTAKS